MTPAQIWGRDLDVWPNDTLSGIRVSSETALNAPAVWACVRLISNDIAGLPLHAFRKRDDFRVEIPTPEWLDRPLPDPNVTRSVFLQQLVTSLLLEGNAFVRFFPSIKNPTAVEVLDPSSVDIHVDSLGIEVTYRSTQARGGILTPAELIHIPFIVLPGKRRGINPVDAARETIGLSLAADQYGAAFFGNGSTMSGFISFPEGERPSDETIAEIKSAFRKRHVGVRNSHSFGILGGGAKWNELNTNNRDSQYLELRQYQVEDVARLFGVPPHLVGSQQPGAVSYSSVEQRSIDYVSKAIQPIVEKVEDAFNRTLRGANTYYKFDLNSLLRADVKTRYETYSIGLQNKFLTGDEVRAWEDLEPKGLGFLETPNNNSGEGGPLPPDGGEPAPPDGAPGGAPGATPDVGPFNVEDAVIRHLANTEFDHDQSDHGLWASKGVSFTPQGDSYDAMVAHAEEAAARADVRDPDDQEAIDIYQSTRWLEINDPLRNGTEPPADAYEGGLGRITETNLVLHSPASDIARLDRLMESEGGLPWDAFLYRGVYSDNVFPDERMPMGFLFQDLGYISSTTDKDNAMSFAFPGNNAPANIVVVIRARKGQRAIVADSEIILPRGTILRIIRDGKDAASGVRVINAEIVR